MKKRIGFGAFALFVGLSAYMLVPAGANGDAKPKDLGSYAVATFAGGCFWCVESGFEKVPGVVEVISGFTGGDEPNPTYKQVSAGKTGYTEAVQVYYDPKAISYEGLLESFWRIFDPTDGDGQFYDRGTQYRPGIFYTTEKQHALAEASKASLAASGRFKKPIAVEIVKFKSFFPAEDYHQDYYKVNPIRYHFYTDRSGRTDFVKNAWGKDLKLDYSKFKPRP